MEKRMENTADIGLIPWFTGIKVSENEASTFCDYLYFLGGYLGLYRCISRNQGPVTGIPVISLFFWLRGPQVIETITSRTSLGVRAVAV